MLVSEQAFSVTTAIIFSDPFFLIAYPNSCDQFILSIWSFAAHCENVCLGDKDMGKASLVSTLCHFLLHDDPLKPFLAKPEICGAVGLHFVSEFHKSTVLIVTRNVLPQLWVRNVM